MVIETPAGELEEGHRDLIEQLAQLAADTTLPDGLGELATSWKEQLLYARERARARLRVLFLGEVGTGKSTLVAATTGLRLADASSSKPKSWSVLPVGAGRTTLGETRVVYEERDDIGLEVEPVPAADLKVELGLLARDHFAEVRGDSGAASLHGGEELYSLLREWLVPGDDDPREMIAAWAEGAPDADALYARFVEGVDPDHRAQPWTRTFPLDDGGRRSLRSELHALRFGEAGPHAPAPAATTIRLPAGALGPEIGEVIDTQGLDAKPSEGLIEGRADLQQRWDDPDTVFVVCSRFEKAPDDTSLALLEALAERADDEGEGPSLVIIDRREPPENAREARAHKRERKRREGECQDRLRRAEGLKRPPARVLVVDARTESGELVEHLVQLSSAERRRREAAWGETQGRARAVLGTLAVRRAEFFARSREIDLRLWWAWDAAIGSEDGARSTGSPVDALDRLGQAIARKVGVEHHAHVAAAVRRRGRYRRLDMAVLGSNLAAVTHALRYGAALRAVEGLAGRLVDGCEDARLVDHARLRIAEFRAGVAAYRASIRLAWRTRLSAYFASEGADGLWADCDPRWGMGSGYLRDVGRRFRRESREAGLRIDPALYEDGPAPRLPRPPLLRLSGVEVENFRGVSSGRLAIGRVTVLAGDNGLYKTGWIEAGAVALGALLPRLGAGRAPVVTVGDVHQEIREINGVPDLRRHLPVSLSVEAELVGRALSWTRRFAALPPEPDETPSDGEPRYEEQPLDESADEDGRGRTRILTEALASDDAVELPVLAYYGTKRLWPAELEADRGRREVGSRLDGYRGCMAPDSTHQYALDWIRRFTFSEMQRGQPIVQLGAVRRAVSDCVEDAEDFYYDVAHEELRLEMKDGRILPFRLLSDGYRNIVAMVADIAWRAAVLNPQLGVRAAQLAEGVVLIDEIDLHLHPKWQRRVIADLRRAFPKLQFVTTTHSPFVIQSLEPGQLINLDPDAEDAPYAGESPEDIAEHVMGVDVPQRSWRRQREAEVAERYYTLLEQIPGADEAELGRLRDELDALIEPYADNQAFAALLRRKRLVAEAQRG